MKSVNQVLPAPKEKMGHLELEGTKVGDMSKALFENTRAGPLTTIDKEQNKMRLIHLRELHHWTLTSPSTISSEGT